jgi:hypothetical protein
VALRGEARRSARKVSGLIPLPSGLTLVEVAPRLGSKYQLTVRFVEVPDPKDIELVEPDPRKADPNFIIFEIDPIAPKSATLL